MPDVTRYLLEQKESIVYIQIVSKKTFCILIKNRKENHLILDVYQDIKGSNPRHTNRS